MIYRVIQAISKHIGTEETLTGTAVGIGINEAAYYGIIVSTLEVIEVGFVIIVIATVANGVDMGKVIWVGFQRQNCAGRAFDFCDLAPSVVLIAGDQGGVIGLGRAIIVASVDRHHVTLQVFSVVVIGESDIPGVFHAYANDRAVFIVQEFQRSDKGAIFLVLYLCQQHGTNPIAIRVSTIGIDLPGTSLFYSLFFTKSFFIKIVLAIDRLNN